MIRKATLDKKEIDTLNELIAQSARGLSLEEYNHDEIEGLIKYVFGVDTELVEDGTYYIIEEEGVFQACGGWSKRKTLYGGNQSAHRTDGYLNPKTDAAKIRAFFVHPQHARKGLGKTLLAFCENEARKMGFSRIEMMATLPGVKLYEVFGYQKDSKEQIVLPNGIPIALVRMSKSLR